MKIRHLPTGLLPAVILPALLVLSGCNLAPHYDRPTIAAPAAFKEAPVASIPSANWAPAQPQDESQRGKWWTIYGDPILNGLEEPLQVSNQTIIAAEANLRAARASVVAARSALFPVVTASPSFARVRSSQTLGTVTTAATPGTAPSPTGVTGTSSQSVLNEYSLPVQASYEVDLWGRVRNSIAASERSAEASAADLATALLSTQAEMAQDYFQLRALDAERSILDDTVGTYRQARDIVGTLFDSGIDSDEDVTRAQNQLDTAIAQATDTRVARAAYEHAIAVLLGKAPADFPLAAAPLTGQPPAVPAGVPSGLLERRPDIAAAERRVAAANSQIGVARAAYYPSLTLSAAGGWESTSLSQWFSLPSRFWSVGPELAGTLFDGGARRAATDQAKALRDQAVANYRETVLTAFQAVEDNLAALQILQREVVQEHTAVESSRHLLDLANNRFQIGIDSYVNVVTAQTALLSDRETEVQVQLRQMAASVSLVAALGGGWNPSRLNAPLPSG